MLAQPLDPRIEHHPAHSPEGRAIACPEATGVPKDGVPSAFQVNGCARITRSHPGVADTLAWYTIQLCVPSGEVVKLACPGP